MTKRISKEKRTRSPIGNVHFGEVNPATICYTLKYMEKPKQIKKHDSRQPEFSLMSKKLGADYLTKAMVSWHKADTENRSYVNIGDGKKGSMPRYYREKIYTTKDSEAINQRRSIRESATAVSQQIPDIIAHQRDKTESKKAAFRKMHSFTKKGNL